jgi:trimeric autotransporter adhesin
MGTFIGDAGNNVLVGTDDNDLLNGLAGNDTLKGGKGDDIYFVDSTKDKLTEAANQGSDTVRSSLQSFTLAANFEHLDLLAGAVNGIGNTLGNEFIGNDADNKLQGLAGDDDIRGGGGSDVLLGGTGSDNMSGQTGFDLLDGGAGDDELIDDQGGGDTLIGGTGNDLYIVFGNDTTIIELANGGIDEVAAGDISFSLIGLNTIENLELFGTGVTGTGNKLANKISGNDGANTLIGGEGNDTLDGGKGGDRMTGNNGDDTYIVDDDGDIVFEDKGGGRDSVLSSVDFAMASGLEIEKVTLTGGNGIGIDGNELANTIVGNNGGNRLDGGIGNDTLSGGKGDDRLIGGIGNDVLKGGEQNDVYFVDSAGDKVIELAGLAVQGRDRAESSLKSYTLAANVEDLLLLAGALNGTGNTLANEIGGNDASNKLDGGVGNDVLGGGIGNDTVLGGAGNDELFGDTGDDSLDGGAGNDILSDAAGKDTMKGGAGNDRYEIGVNGGNVTIIEAANAGVDEVFSLKNFSLQTLANVENLVLEDAATIGTGNALNNRIVGGASDNTLSGLGGNDTLDGGGGADRLEGGFGNDTYFVDQFGETILEGDKAGKDTVFSSDTYALMAGQEIEVLTLTGDGDNAAIGNDRANTLNGNAGANVLSGLGGNDTMAGGKGDDFYRVDDVGDKVIEAAKGGTDTVASSLASHTLGANVENLHLFGNGLNGTGNTLANDIDGNTLANKLDGGAGDDTLLGASGEDTLIGGAGNDTLEGGLGVDILTGGAGKDVYLYRIENAGELDALGEDAINGFTRGADKIDISDLLDDFAIDPANAITGGFLELSNNNGNTIVRFDSNGGGDSFVALVAVNNAVLTEADFVL